MNAKKEENLEIKNLLRLLRRAFFRRLLPSPVSHLLVFVLCFLRTLYLGAVSDIILHSVCLVVPEQQSTPGKRPTTAPVESADFIATADFPRHWGSF